MSHLLARIMLAVFMLPAAAIVYTIVLLTLIEGRRIQRYFAPPGTDWAWVIAGVVTWCFVAIYWVLLWRKSVAWNPSRKRLTLLAAGAAAVLGALAGLGTRWIDDEFGYFIFSTVTVLVWLPLTVLIWRESPAERAARLSGVGAAIVCPTCGYNLTGLSTARCPECGTQFTLDDLLSRQPGREAGEIDAV